MNASSWGCGCSGHCPDIRSDGRSNTHVEVHFEVHIDGRSGIRCDVRILGPKIGAYLDHASVLSQALLRQNFEVRNHRSCCGSSRRLERVVDVAVSSHCLEKG